MNSEPSASHERTVAVTAECSVIQTRAPAAWLALSARWIVCLSRAAALKKDVVTQQVELNLILSVFGLTFCTQ